MSELLAGNAISPSDATPIDVSVVWRAESSYLSGVSESEEWTMAFRDTQPRASVCQGRASQRVGESLRPEKGPSDRAVRLLEIDGGTRSAWPRWHCTGDARLSGILGLPRECLESLGSLSRTVAYSSKMDQRVSAWSKTAYLEGLSPHN